MPVSTPNAIIAAGGPVIAENYSVPGIIRTENDSLDFYNRTGSTILPGEPIWHQGRIALAYKPILPGEVGLIYFNWVADFILDPALGSAIIVNDIVYWSYALNWNTAEIPSGVGAVAKASPVNGFILGRAVYDRSKPLILSSGSPVAASVGDLRIRVAAQTLAVAAIGTIPFTFN